MLGLDELNVSLTKEWVLQGSGRDSRSTRAMKCSPTFAADTRALTLTAPKSLKCSLLILVTKELPEEWDEIRNYSSKRAIEAFVFISILFSHHLLITVFAKSMTAEMRGVLKREDLDEKAYTNLIYSMQN